jgi:hypothetical protein
MGNLIKMKIINAAMSLCLSQGFQYFSTVPVLHYLQAVLFIKILTIFMNFLYKSLKSGGTKDYFRWVKVCGTERPAVLDQDLHLHKLTYFLCLLFQLCFEVLSKKATCI